MRDTSSRREKIVSMLRSNGSVQVYPLADMFGVSAVTIRKDLKFLEQRGVASRAYGGAILNELVPTTENAVGLKQQLNPTKKDSIAKAAAAFVSSGESLILDSGTTTNLIVPYLCDFDELTVVTNDLLAVNQLADCASIELIVLGGTLRRKSMFFHGQQAEKALKDLHVDKLFLGVDGFHMQKGVTTHFEPEATLNRMMCKASTEVIVVTDSTKFGKICLYKILEPLEISKLITDDGIPDEYREGLMEMGIDVIVVGSDS
ncbi:transcriptional repressor AgaR [Microbulbifer litoralis]|uniref:transcriptional repressor AgaR n=1 Tax=Microbulbifer litoralis TaxID=2933965 RepID=UPI002540DC9C|nr:transcriptional repressor AgaR [Microbulbifer sp. GX H0434]